MLDIKEVADKADMIVSGYAFTKDGDMVRILNLSAPSRAAVLDKNGEIVETNKEIKCILLGATRAITAITVRNKTIAISLSLCYNSMYCGDEQEE